LNFDTAENNGNEHAKSKHKICEGILHIIGKVFNHCLVLYSSVLVYYFKISWVMILKLLN